MHMLNFYPFLICFIEQLEIGRQDNLHSLCVSFGRSVVQARPALVVTGGKTITHGEKYRAA